MNAELLMIGTELLLGQIQDTNASYMGQTLALHGINLFQKTTVGDNQQRIMAALDGALSRAGVVLCSGGLGPTEDDITRECIAELLGRKLEFRQALWDEVVQRFAPLRVKITENNKRQATLPVGAIAIDNPHGTAPGLIIEDARGIIICMPGVPMELKPMLETKVIPYLLRKFGQQGVLHCRVLKVCAMGESRVDSIIGDLILASTNPTIGLLASPDAVRIRIAARASSIVEAQALVAPVEDAIRGRLDGLIMGADNDTLEAVVDQLLQERGWKLGLLEQSTGGMIAQRLSAAGARSFAHGVVLPLGRSEESDMSDWSDRSDRSATPAPSRGELPGVDRGISHLLDSGLDCVLAVVADSVESAVRVVFQTPSGRQEWSIGHLGSGERSQIRTSVFALEQVRRWLTGVKGRV